MEGGEQRRRHRGASAPSAGCSERLANAAPTKAAAALPGAAATAYTRGEFAQETPASLLPQPDCGRCRPGSQGARGPHCSPAMCRMAPTALSGGPRCACCAAAAAAAAPPPTCALPPAAGWLAAACCIGPSSARDSGFTCRQQDGSSQSSSAANQAQRLKSRGQSAAGSWALPRITEERGPHASADCHWRSDQGAERAPSRSTSAPPSCHPPTSPSDNAAACWLGGRKLPTVLGPRPDSMVACGCTSEGAWTCWACWAGGCWAAAALASACRCCAACCSCCGCCRRRLWVCCAGPTSRSGPAPDPAPCTATLPPRSASAAAVLPWSSPGCLLGRSAIGEAPGASPPAVAAAAAAELASESASR